MATAVVFSLCLENLADMVEIESLSNPIPWSEHSLRGEFSNPCSVLLGVRSAGALRGFVLAHVVAGEAHIVSFAVHPESRRQGLGKALLIELLARLNSDGCLWVTLEVRQGNVPALSLYRSLGFFEAGVRVSYYRDNGEDAHVMRLNLRDRIFPQ